MDSQQNIGAALLAEQRWAVWQLAPDIEAYGAFAGHYIIVTEDGHLEPVPDQPVFATRIEAERVVAKHNLEVERARTQADGWRA